MDQPSLSGPRAKYRRGREHIEALQRKIDQFAHDNPDPKVEEFDPETGRYTVAIKFRKKPDGEGWGILLGDAIQNLRSVLDHIVWQLVRLNRERPGHQTYWPSVTSEERYWSPRKCGRPSVREEALRGVGDEPRALIDSLQPYTAGTAMDQHFLSLLIPLSNADKHRVVQAGFFAIEEPPEKFLARNEDVGDVLEGTFASGPLDEDAPFLDARFEITGPNPHVQMERDLTLIVGFGEERFSFPAIREIVPKVGQVIDAFQPFFDREESE